MGQARLLWLLAASALLVGLAAVGGEAAPDAGDVSIVSATTEGLTLTFTPPGHRSGAVEAEICDLEGRMLAKVTGRHGGRPLELKMSAPLDTQNMANYYLRYRFGPDTEWQRCSLFFMGEVLETIVLGQREYLAGTRAVLRVIVRNRAAGKPVPGAGISASLYDADALIAEHKTQSNENGEAEIRLDLPGREVRGARLTVRVESRTAGDTVEETIHVRPAARTLLTTDKPMYQPGQTIHIRALSLSRPGMQALADTEATFEVEDGKGNKVFKKRVRSDEFGVSHADFALAYELNQGTYRIRSIVGGATEEKTVTVDRYVLPKFKIDFQADRAFYEPGDTVKAELQMDYFFGKPVAGAKVHVSCAKFDVEYVDFQTVEGKTDENGRYAFDVRLPEHFVGQPLEAGKASAKFDITVIDTADHREKATRNLSVTASPIIIATVPEAGRLIAGLENRVYVVTTYADSTPARCGVTWTSADGNVARTLRTDEGGFGEILLTPKEGEALTLTLEARDAEGSTGKATVTLGAKDQPGDDRILLRTDRSLYNVGDRLNLNVATTRRSGSVYVDLIKDRQTHLTRTLSLRDGKATGAVSLEAGLAGTVQVNAYLIGNNGVIIRDSRLVVVDPANDLSVTVSRDQETYLPGVKAVVTFQVKDREGRGTASALGVMVVDEAVFALQEMQPGLEKVYFYLEKEIARPRYEIHGYEIHGYEIGDVMPTSPTRPAPEQVARRDKAARVLLASAEGVGEYQVRVNTYDRDRKGEAFTRAMQQAMGDRPSRIQEALSKFSAERSKSLRRKLTEGVDLETLVRDGYLAKNDALDPWDQPMKIEGQWNVDRQTYWPFTVRSAGIDGKWDTADDVSLQSMQLVRHLRGGVFGMDAVNGRMPMAVPGLAFEGKAAMAGVGGGNAAGPEPPRIRRYFPETLYFNPALITDGRGRVTLDIPMADSITTWRLTCMASSTAGQLGSTTAPLRVFQDFFVDIDFPVSLTQNDEVWVPVAVYNYLTTDQEVRLVVEPRDWFELKGEAEKTLTLGPSEVRAVHFPVVARKVGFQKFTVLAYGARKSDAVERSVEIVPDGREQVVSHSGRLEGKVSHTIHIPDDAIEDASKVFVKVYPGVLSQVAEGLDSMLRMPFGCFEQTSSVTYPNVLILDYMKTTGKVTPELQMKAEGLINAGYQRLVSYEVEGGGFEWFGNPPAHRILTAYGLMEFYDMSKVHEVDPAIITRTQQWLAGRQEADGSWKPSEGGIREGAIDKFTDDVFRNTAYITWALASTGYKGPQVNKGIQYLAEHLDQMSDNYTVALTANAFAAVDPQDRNTVAVLDTLHGRRTEEGDVVHWRSQSETPTHGTGDAADIEVTGLAVQALVSAGRHPQTVGKAVTWLVKNKDAFGTWQSTQATIQALRAMLTAEAAAAASVEAAIGLTMNGKPVTTLRVDASNSDVLQLVDLKELTRTGDNVVELDLKGEGSLMYQVVGRHFVPSPKLAPVPGTEPMTITVEYDRTELATEDILGVTATVINNRPARAKMVIVDLGLPPGFTLIPAQLDGLVETGKIQKYSVTGRQIIVYLRELGGNGKATMRYQLLAKYPLRAKTTKSAVYEYYNPSVRAETEPVELIVQK